MPARNRWDHEQASDQDDDEPELTREDRLRRVVLVCTFFMRNLAYYRGARESPAGWWIRRSARKRATRDFRPSAR